MAGKVRQNAKAVKITLKPRDATRATKQHTQAPVIQDAYPQTPVIPNAYTQTLTPQDAYTQPPGTRLTVAVQDHTQHATNMEMSAVLTPYQRMRELLSMVRLRFVDAEAPGSLEDMISVFKTPYESNRDDVDSMLVTVTVWNMKSDSELLPTPGSVVDIIEYSHLQLFRGNQCQLTARLTQMRWSADLLVMSGQGNGAHGRGQGGVARHRKVISDDVQGITRSAIHSLARLAGIIRISGFVYHETRAELRVLLANLIH
ncbi:hypothetical protein JG688_00014744 [Phytophthora aleatoria]|uniref:Uncharacterized protein n=1 Tax=Phytophthora aleatoria TaxID=2496075 RepID=A0A8J5LXC8_9STRA|nr:hypothetical protein JG688_00014744 [Phytophthora aleatoria]